jgi:rhodanese-related sulfurtransferase
MLIQILQFIQNHWLLSSALLVLILWLIFEELKNRVKGIPKLSPQAAVLLLNRENAAVIDLRSQNSFFSGHINGAINLERNAINQDEQKLSSYKSRPLILVDEQEANALSVATKLRAQGFAKIYLLGGGLSSWKDAGFPLNQK